MKQYPLNRYVPGTYKKECDRCGFDFLRSELQKESDTGSIVCKSCLDPHDEQLNSKKRQLLINRRY